MEGAVLDQESLRELIENPQAGQLPLVEGLLSLEEQLQPTGIDLCIQRVERLASAGRLGRANEDRVLSECEPLSFESDGWLFLGAGSYLVTLNEIVNIPLDLIALGLPRSSLMRSGASLHTAVWDAGYRGRSQALLNVYNAAGFHLQQNTRLLQMIFLRLARPVGQGYQGRYQDERP